MSRESFLVVASSLFVLIRRFEASDHAGFIIFHIILLVASFFPKLHWTDGLNKSYFRLRPTGDSGVELGSLLVPMVLTGILMSTERHPQGNSNLSGDLKCYLTASQLMGMFIISILLLLNKSCQVLSWALFCAVSLCFAATVNSQYQDGIFSLLLWLFISVALLMLMLCLFPKSFTLGESMLVIQTIILLSVDSWVTLKGKLHQITPYMQGAAAVSRSVYTIWSQVLLFGSLMTGFLLLPVFYYLTIVSDPFEYGVGVISFYVVILLVFVALLFPWCFLMLGAQNPLGWMIHFIIYTNTRKYLFIYWSCVVTLSIGVVIWRNRLPQGTRTSTVVRKYFHILALAIFLPGFVWEPDLTHLASCVAVAAFIFLEYIRMARMPPLGQPIDDALTVFLDEKDTGPVILTPIYLLLGCSLPLWLLRGVAKKSGVCTLAVYSGLLSLGVGDTAASIVGKRFGRHRWSGSLKTVEGTLAGIAAQVLCVVALAYGGLVTVHLSDWPAVFSALTASSLLEAWTSQVDNLILPPFLLSLLIASCI